MSAKRRRRPKRLYTKLEHHMCTWYLMWYWGPDETREQKKAVWRTLGFAGQLYDSGFVHVEIGDKVLELGRIRKMTGRDRALIADAADEYSASK